MWHPSIVVQDGETSPDEALDPPLPLHVHVVGTVHHDLGHLRKDPSARGRCRAVDQSAGGGEGEGARVLLSNMTEADRGSSEEQL